MAKKFEVNIKLGNEEISHEVNCDNEISARFICEVLYPNAIIEEISDASLCKSS